MAQWPPNPENITPIFQILDIAFLWFFTIVVLWSSVGCIELAQVGGVTAPKGGMGGKFMLVEDKVVETIADENNIVGDGGIDTAVV